MKTIEEREIMVRAIAAASKEWMTLEKKDEIKRDVANVNFKFDKKNPEKSGIFHNGKRQSGPY